MNKVWEIIEHRREDRSSEGMGPMGNARRSGRFGKRMSGRKSESEDYYRGMKDGFCAAVEMLEDVVDSLEEED